MVIIDPNRPLHMELNDVRQMLTSSLPSTVRHITLEIARGPITSLSPSEDERLVPTWAGFEREITRRYPELQCLEFADNRVHYGHDCDAPSLESLVKRFFSNDFGKRVKFRFAKE